MEWGGRILMGSTAKDFSHLRSVEQVQQSLQGAAVVGGGVELEGKSASIKSISECIQLSNASSCSICTLPCFRCSISLSSCFSRISLTGSRRQLSIRKNERKGDNDEPDPPLLLERELAVGEVDVAIERNRAIRPTIVPTTASSRALPSKPTATRAAPHPDPEKLLQP